MQKGAPVSAIQEACTANGYPGSKKYSNGRWSHCIRVPGSCRANEFSHNNTCHPATKSCTPGELSAVHAATGAKVYTQDGSYSTCNATTCSNGYHKEGGTCVSNTALCTMLSGIGGEMNWDSVRGAWGACTVICSSRATVYNDACYVNRKSCSRGDLPTPKPPREPKPMRGMGCTPPVQWPPVKPVIT